MNIRTVNDVNSVIKDYNKSVAERKEYVNTLSEQEMRLIFLELCEVWENKYNEK